MRTEAYISAAALALATDSLRAATMTSAVAASDSENCTAHAMLGQSNAMKISTSREQQHASCWHSHELSQRPPASSDSAYSPLLWTQAPLKDLRQHATGYVKCARLMCAALH